MGQIFNNAIRKIYKKSSVIKKYVMERNKVAFPSDQSISAAVSPGHRKEPTWNTVPHTTGSHFPMTGESFESSDSVCRKSRGLFTSVYTGEEEKWRLATLKI